MTIAMSAHHALARGLLCAEMEDSEAVLDVPAIAERALEKLSQRLALLITPIGSEALLARAVHLSRAEAPFLAAAPQATLSTHALAQRLRDSAADLGSTEACEGFLAVLGNLIALLVSFIGEDLTSRVLRDVWPELPMVQPVQPIRRNGTSNATGSHAKLP